MTKLLQKIKLMLAKTNKLKTYLRDNKKRLIKKYICQINNDYYKFVTVLNCTILYLRIHSTTQEESENSIKLTSY